MSKRRNRRPDFKAKATLDSFRGERAVAALESQVEALNEVIDRFGLPRLMNTDQGSQPTSFVWAD